MGAGAGGRLQAWRALRVADATCTLSAEVAGFVDGHVAVVACRDRVPGPGQLRDLVAEALARVDPDAIRGIEGAASADRDVRFDHHTGTGVSS